MDVRGAEFTGVDLSGTQLGPSAYGLYATEIYYCAGDEIIPPDSSEFKPEASTADCDELYSWIQGDFRTVHREVPSELLKIFSARCELPRDLARRSRVPKLLPPS